MKKLIVELRNYAASKSLKMEEVGCYRVDIEGDHYLEEEYLALKALPSSKEVSTSIPSIGEYPVVLYVKSEVND
jgi:hypothetical protein